MVKFRKQPRALFVGRIKTLLSSAPCSVRNLLMTLPARVMQAPRISSQLAMALSSASASAAAAVPAAAEISMHTFEGCSECLDQCRKFAAAVELEQQG